MMLHQGLALLMEVQPVNVRSNLFLESWEITRRSFSSALLKQVDLAHRFVNERKFAALNLGLLSHRCAP